MIFHDGSTAGTATIYNTSGLTFYDDSSAGNATLETLAGADTRFRRNSTGGNAQLITDAGGTVDFSLERFTKQPTAGSIAGAGEYDLGAVEFTVGSNNRSTEVSGIVKDGGLGGGSGASLVKVGLGTLTLSHAGNTYSGGTTLIRGTLDLAAVGAAGTGAITFVAGKQILKIENGALLGHHFGNEIDFFGRHDVLDLTSLRFHPGATAKYHAFNDTLKVHSGHVTDILTVDAPQGTHFATAGDGHGGTDVFLVFA